MGANYVSGTINFTILSKLQFTFFIPERAAILEIYREDR